MTTDIRADLVSWPGRVTGTSEVREDGVLKGFLVTLTYPAFGQEKSLTFCHG